MEYVINGQTVTLNEIREILQDELTISLGDIARNKISGCRSYLDNKLDVSDKSHYGINTGFGSLYNVKIGQDAMDLLQKNLIKSHASGAGDFIENKHVQLILLLKIISLSKGHSAVSVELVERLIDMYNQRIWPKIHRFGSLGASGDLAPLAHLSLPLIGKGKVDFQDQISESDVILQQMGWEPLHLKSKEGLALINGTQFSAAFLIDAVIQGAKLWQWASFIGACSIDAFDCSSSPFHVLVNAVRNHDSQSKTASMILKWLEGSQILKNENKHVQDPYAFRCIPQVLGASLEVINHVANIAEGEANAVTDNPLIFPEEDMILSGGNFHAQPVALSADYLALALAEMGSISERRSFQLLCGKRELPEYLVRDAGLNSGFMISQYTAASLVNQNKMLCSPNSVDNITSSKGQEDHVSMAANGAFRLQEIIENLWTILSIEFMIASQALDLRDPLRSSETVEKLKSEYRNEVQFLSSDRILSTDIEATRSFLQRVNLNEYG